MDHRRSGRSCRWQPFALACALFLVAGSHSAAADDAAVAVADSECGCFVINGTNETYFQSHTFFDFRSLSQYEGTPELLGLANETTIAPLTSDYFSTGAWASFWQIQQWNNSASITDNTTVLRVNSNNNVFIARNADASPASDTYLALRTAREEEFQSAAEIVSFNDTLRYLSMRMLARTVGDAGACTAMFTYRPAASSDDGGSGSGTSSIAENDVLQEADLEVLTKYPKSHVQCTNQPSTDSDGALVDAATTNATLPDNGSWSDWAVYRLDWTPQQSTWYVNGALLANISYQAPRDPSWVHINAWSDGSSWTGAMALDGQATLQIQWWELLYNTTVSYNSTVSSAASNTTRCKNVCSVDTANNTNSVGQSYLVSGAGRLARPGLMAWLPSVVAALVLMGSLSI